MVWQVQQPLQAFTCSLTVCSCVLVRTYETTFLPFQCKVNAERTARNVLQGNLTISQAKLVFGQGFEWPHNLVAVGFSCLAMGDLLCC